MTGIHGGIGGYDEQHIPGSRLPRPVPTSRPSSRRSRSKSWLWTASVASTESSRALTYLVPDQVRVRREDFGLLFYDTRSTRLTFVRSGDRLDPAALHRGAARCGRGGAAAPAEPAGAGAFARAGRSGSKGTAGCRPERVTPLPPPAEHHSPPRPGERHLGDHRGLQPGLRSLPIGRVAGRAAGRTRPRAVPRPPRRTGAHAGVPGELRRRRALPPRRLPRHPRATPTICGITTCVSTNGTLLDDALVDALLELGARKPAAPVYLQVSLDGARAETNDAIRGTGTFVRITGGDRTAVSARVSRLQPQHGGDAARTPPRSATSIVWLASYGAKTRLSRFRPSGGGCHTWEDYRLTREQLARAVRLSGRPPGDPHRRLVLRAHAR